MFIAKWYLTSLSSCLKRERKYKGAGMGDEIRKIYQNDYFYFFTLYSSPVISTCPSCFRIFVTTGVFLQNENEGDSQRTTALPTGLFVLVAYVILFMLN